MEGQRISLDAGTDRSAREPTIAGLPPPVVPLRSRRRPPSAPPKKRPESPFNRLREALTLLGWCAMFLAAGFLAAAQPPSTYNFFARLGHTRTTWDQDALTAALATSLIAALWALIAVGLPGRLDEVRPRLWALLVVAACAAAALGLS